MKSVLEQKPGVAELRTPNLERRTLNFERRMGNGETGRVQLRRVRGWQMPAGTVKVDRTTAWGNPFVVGVHGDAAQCVERFARLCCGWLTITVDGDCFRRQQAFLAHLKAHREELRGKNLACWCRPGAPCHADVLVRIARFEAVTVALAKVAGGWK